jgi:hypothetical protein
LAWAGEQAIQQMHIRTNTLSVTSFRFASLQKD